MPPIGQSCRCSVYRRQLAFLQEDVCIQLYKVYNKSVMKCKAAVVLLSSLCLHVYLLMSYFNPLSQIRIVD